MTTSRCLTGRVQQLLKFTSSAMHHLWNMDFPWCGNCWHFSLPVALIWTCKFFQMSSCEWRACDPDSFCVARQKMRNMSSVHVQDTHLQIARLSHTLIQGMYPANRNKLMIMIILSIYIHIPALPRWAEGTHTHTHIPNLKPTDFCFKDVLPEFWGSHKRVAFLQSLYFIVNLTMSITHHSSITHNAYVIAAASSPQYTK